MYQPKFSTLLISLMLLFQSAPALCMTRTKIPVTTARQYTASVLRHRHALNPRGQLLRMSKRNMDPGTGKILFEGASTAGNWLWGTGAALVTWLTTSTDESGKVEPERLNPFRKWSDQEARDIRRASKVLQEIRLQQYGHLGDIATNKHVPQYIKDGINSAAMQYVVDYFAGVEARKRQKKSQATGAGAGAGAAGAGAPKDPKENKDNKEKNPHGKYEENPKHHKNAPGRIGKPPKNGQKTLDNSIEVGKGRRIGVEDGKLVEFKEHAPGNYHGYIIENPSSLINDIKTILKEQGLMHPKKETVIV